MGMEEDRVTGLLLELATAFGRMHGRLLAQLSLTEALGNGDADNLLIAEERLIARLRHEGQSDPQVLALLTAMVQSASEPVQKTFDELNGAPRAPRAP